MATWAVPDPALLAARQAEQAAVDARVAAHLAEQQAALDEAGLKVCLFPNDCAELIPADAAKCPVCGGSQGLGTGGVASASARAGQVSIGGVR